MTVLIQYAMLSYYGRNPHNIQVVISQMPYMQILLSQMSYM